MSDPNTKEPPVTSEPKPEHQERDVVTGRVIAISGGSAQVELGLGIQATCRVAAEHATQEASTANHFAGAKADLTSLSSMLQARWKSGAVAESLEPQEVREGQVRGFRITKLDRPAKKIEVELA